MKRRSTIQHFHPPGSSGRRSGSASASTSRTGSRDRASTVGSLGTCLCDCHDEPYCVKPVKWDELTGLEKWLRMPKKIAKEEFYMLCTQYIVECMLPFTHVEHPGFRRFIHGFVSAETLAQWGLVIPTAAIIAARIEQLHRRDKDNLIKVFKQTQYVCTTADIWSGYRRGYMGVTAHWIDHKTLARQTAVLSFRLVGNVFEKYENLFPDPCKTTPLLLDTGKSKDATRTKGLPNT